jgi:ankyrin repeat protein
MSAAATPSSPGGDDLLRKAIAEEDTHTVNFLLNHGVIPIDENLHYAVEEGLADIVRSLYSSDLADFSLAARQEALETCIWEENADVLQLVLEVGRVDPNFTICFEDEDDDDDDDYSPSCTWTPLHLATGWYSPLESVEALIAHGARINPQDKKGRSPLHVVVRRDSAELVTCLLRHGADPNARDNASMTPLHLACRDGRLEAAQALLRGGADPNAVNDCEWTCVHLAIVHGQQDVLQWLIVKAGASPRPRVSSPPMHEVPFMSATVLMPSALIHLGIDPSQTDCQGDTALHYAVREPCDAADTDDEDDGDEDDVEEDPADDITQRLVFVSDLLECQPKLVNKQNHKGKTALHLASAWSTDLTKLLVQQHQADLLAKDSYGQTPLIHAILEHAGEVTLECLLILMKEHAVPLETDDDNGWTALHWAIFDGNETAARLLLECGAKVDAVNRCGRQPLHLTGYRFRAGRTAHSFDDGDISRTVNTSFPTAWLETQKPKDAARAESNETLPFLLQRGADATALDQYGNLPFFLAAATSHVDELFLMLRTSATQGLFEAFPKLAVSTSRGVAPTEKRIAV